MQISRETIGITVPPNAGLAAILWQGTGGTGEKYRIYYPDVLGDIRELRGDLDNYGMVHFVQTAYLHDAAFSGARYPISAVVWISGDGQLQIRVYFQGPGASLFREMAWEGSLNKWRVDTLRF